jgi:hypothetical protein
MSLRCTRAVHLSPFQLSLFKLLAISRQPGIRAILLSLSIPAGLLGCGGRKPVSSTTPTAPTEPRVLAFSRVIVLETSGPPPSDTSVTFTAGDTRTIILRHGPPENIVFARLTFLPQAFGDSGQMVRVDVHPRPGVYGIDLTTSQPLRGNGASLRFEYARFFSAPARARQVYGSDVIFERALAVGRLLPDARIELLPPSRPAADVLAGSLPATGTYLVAAPQ